MPEDIHYVVETNLDPAQLSAVGVEIFSRWLGFALGQQSLGGRMLKHPTGRYAASIRYKATGQAEVAIMADTTVAPEGGILETGHGRFDLKSVFQQNRAYPMHRGGKGGAPTMRASMWATARRANATGYASFGPNTDADKWILPAMPAYSPAQILAELAAKIGRAGGMSV